MTFSSSGTNSYYSLLATTGPAHIGYFIHVLRITRSAQSGTEIPVCSAKIIELRIEITNGVIGKFQKE